jgi:hypothetical protein
MEAIFAPAGQTVAMSNSGIGVPQIEPRHRVSWRGARHPPNRDNDKDRAEAGKDDRPQPEAGTGEIVDKVV